MSKMLDQILALENIQAAKERVYSNKGVGGVDGVTVFELDEFTMNIWRKTGLILKDKSERENISRNLLGE